MSPFPGLDASAPDVPECATLNLRSRRQRSRRMSAQQHPLTDHRIVVGVDGSESSKAALAWAVEQAKLTSATVEAVIAWHYPVAFAGVPYAPIGSPMDTDLAGTAGQVLGMAISAT